MSSTVLRPAVLAAAVAFAIPVLGQDAKVERGKAVFAEQKCRICHSVAGQGNPKGSLDGVGAKLKADEMKQWLVSPKEMMERTKATRKPPMKSFKDLPPADIDALVAYLQTLKK